MKATSAILAAVAFGFVLLVTFRTDAAPPFQHVPIEGDVAPLRELAGRWYDHNAVAVAKVALGPRPRLGLRFPPPYRLVDARAGEAQVLFTVLDDDEQPIALTFRLADDGVGYVLPPGAEIPWCAACDPGLTRSFPQALSRWASSAMNDSWYRTKERMARLAL